MHTKIHQQFSCLCCGVIQLLSGSEEVDQRLIDYMKVTYTRMFFFCFVFHIYASYFGGHLTQQLEDCSTTGIRQQDGECHS